jgi:DNA-binding CsgD family transcriptional regulator
MSSESTFLELIGLIYEAAGDPELWPNFLRKLSGLTGATVANIGYLDQQAVDHQFAYAHGLDTSDVHRYNAHYSKVDAWLQRAPKEYWTPGFVGLSHQICSDQELERTEFYNDYARSVGFYYGMSAVILREESLLSVLSIVREKSKGPCEVEEALLFRSLVPHLQRAMALHQRIGRLQATAQSTVDLLDRLPIGLGLADYQGRISMLNRHARSILGQSDGLTMKQGRHYASRSDETKQLHMLLHRAASTGAGNDFHPGGVTTISRPSLRRPFGILVSPLRHASAWLGREQPRAVIFISDPEGELEEQDEVLARLFGLTSAEAKLAALLMRGNTLKSAAEELGISRNTTHSQLQKVFEKTGTHRQAALIRILLSSPTLLKQVE